nr:hypothetical protein [Candidatus Sigynarchaeota archaeon]
MMSKEQNKNFYRVIGSMCILIIGLMLLFAGLVSYMNGPDESIFMFIVGVVIFVCGIAICMLGVKKSSKPWANVEMDQEGQEFIKKRTILQYTLLAVTLVSTVACIWSFSIIMNSDRNGVPL